MIAQVGTIAANNDKQIGGIIAEAIKKVGRMASSRRGIKTMETTLEVSKACSLTGLPPLLRPPTPSAWNRARGRAHPHYEKKISSMKDLLPLLEQTPRWQAPSDHR